MSLGKSNTLSPPEYAKRLGVKAAKVILWIQRGKLRAVNAATHQYGRPRWRIPPDAIAEFEARRAAKPVAKVSRRQQRQEQAVIEFF